MKKLLMALIVLFQAGGGVARSTHGCRIEAYLVETSTGKSNVRNAPEGKVIASLNNKAPVNYRRRVALIVIKKVIIVGQAGEWFQISKILIDNSPNGYSTLPRMLKPTLDLAFVHQSLVAVRSKDSEDIPVYVEPNNREANLKTPTGFLPPGQEIKMKGCYGEYAQVISTNGAIGYAHTQSTAPERDTGTETSELRGKPFLDEVASEVLPSHRFP